MVQGSGIDASLNETGKRQARDFYNAYADYPFDKIYISKLIRTKESVQSFIDKGIDYEALAGLNEISWGSQEGKPFTPETASIYKETTDRWRRGELDLNLDGGESPNAVMKRQKEAFTHILSRQHERQVLICMHGRAIRILLCWIQGIQLSEMDQFEHQNLGLYELGATDSGFEILRRNDVSHISFSYSHDV